MSLNFRLPDLLPLISAWAILTGNAFSDETQNAIRKLGGGSFSGDTGVSVSTPERPAPEVKITYLTAVSTPRQWSTLDGRSMVGQLMAFSSTQTNNDGPIIVIKNGKVNLMRSGAKKPSEFPLAQLSPEDQELVKSIAKAALNASVKKESESASPIAKPE